MAKFFDRETLILMAGVLIGTGSTIVTMAHGFGVAASFAMSGAALLVSAAIIEIGKR